MRRTDFIEWGIVVIALIFGYKFFESILTVFIQIIYGFDSSLSASDIIRTFLVMAVYAAAFFLVIRNSRKIAISVSGQHPDEPVAVKLGKRALLQVILIAVCAYTILSNIADLLFFLFDQFRNEVNSRPNFDQDTYSYTSDKYLIYVRVLRIVLACVIIYTSKFIADWMIPRNEAEELAFDSKPEN